MECAGCGIDMEVADIPQDEVQYDEHGNPYCCVECMCRWLSEELYDVPSVALTSSNLVSPKEEDLPW